MYLAEISRGGSVGGSLAERLLSRPQGFVCAL